MTRRRQDLGLAGEEIAARHLEAGGYRILARRYRTRLGEIDLVVRRGPLLVFVEVRTRRGGNFGTPAESVDRRKQARLFRVASLFLAKHQGPGGSEPVCRFDVVAVTMAPGVDPSVEHVVDAFRPGL